ncbi:type III-B CRISPR module-associated protein Cmr5 [Thermococcus sp. MAR1]|uniref:type III-B CRISPR module-associated protein Cmr5 n=1 Tax=Thermococcus sp. MAR1 TaxID=1638263 RepID=UPI001438EA51|nr:type III-B CRISPR module-associated protein Cmr5 [Thermococcus sp. MAR1]NJE10066.1 type III-B CRISPR module-associated protein Cmr5 [Thermococcus sp. MAR1]
MSTEQERAKFAYDKVSGIKGKGFEDDYKSYVKRAPAMILTNGLIQTLAYYKSKSKGADAYEELFNQINEWLKSMGYFKEDCNENRVNNVLEWLIKCANDIEIYMATLETLSLLNWLKRFADAMIGKKGEKS